MSSETLPTEPTSGPEIRLSVPPRTYLLPGTAVVVGAMIGLRRGARTAAMQFLAENVHRPPTTVQGWYFYQKTKNYRVLMTGLKEAGREAGKLGVSTAVWVAIAEGCERAGGMLGDAGEVVASVGSAGVFAGMYRLQRQMAWRAVGLGLIVGCTLKGLRWSREQLRGEAERKAEDEN